MEDLENSLNKSEITRYNCNIETGYDEKQLTSVKQLDMSTKEKANKDDEQKQINDASLDADCWFSVLNNEYETSGNIYQTDRNGNIIAKVNIKEFKATAGDGSITYLNELERKQFKEKLETTKKEINFLKTQEKFKEEIKGYPEFSETALKIYNHDETTRRFKNELSTLRSLFPPNKVDSLRLLLSIVALNKLDYYKELVADNIFMDVLNNTLDPTRKVYDNINNCIETTEELPTLQLLINVLELPYSKEFFEEYLLNEQDLEYEINRRYDRRKKQLYDVMVNKIKEEQWTASKINNVFKKLEEYGTPPKLDESFIKLEEFIGEKEEAEILSTGIPALDEYNACLQKGKISTVFAYTGSFKTMFCVNTAYNVMNTDSNVVYLSLEISKEEMYINFLSRHSYNFEKKISHSDIKSGRISAEDKEYFFQKIYSDFKNNLKDKLIIYDETDVKKNTYSNYASLLYQADKQFTKKTGHGVDLVIIDHLNLLKFDNGEKTQNDYSAINHWMSFFRKNCISFLGQKKQVSILCACQSSRSGFQEAEKHGKYKLTNIAEGNEIERSSHLVLSIYTNDKNRAENKTVMQILKFRDNKVPSETLDIYLEPKYYTFGIKQKDAKVNNNQTTQTDYSSYENDTSVFEEDDN